MIVFKLVFMCLNVSLPKKTDKASLLAIFQEEITHTEHFLNRKIIGDHWCLGRGKPVYLKQGLLENSGETTDWTKNDVSLPPLFHNQQKCGCLVTPPEI